MGQPKRILVVEDDFHIRMILVQLLMEEGDEGIESNRATKALEVLKQQKVDLITLDLSMPEMTGNEFLLELSRQGARVATIPVIIVSANPNLLNFTPQVKRVIPKPFDISLLAETVEQLG